MEIHKEMAATSLIILAVVKRSRSKRKRYRRQRSVWVKPWLANRQYKSAFNNIFAELRLRDQEEFRKYLRMNTEAYEVYTLFISIYKLLLYTP